LEIDILNEKKQISRKVTIINELGMHARPAAKIAEMAEVASGGIWISNGTNTVDASSIIDILAMCAIKGTKVVIEVENTKDIEVMNTIADLFEHGFGET
jgi:phosphocarrier protein HPr